MNKTWYKSFLIFVLFSSVSARGQVVWPGDVNNNGVVNGVDVLYLGLAFGSTGPERANGTEDWTAQDITTLWGTSFPGGPDYAYADCDGDGEVDDEDLDDVIKINFGLTHGPAVADGYSNGDAGVHPALQLEPEAGAARPGTALNIDLRLGTVDFPVDNFYGIALKMSYSAGMLDETADEEGFDFNLQENAWVEAGNSETVDYLFSKDHATGKAELAITRLDQRIIGQGEGTLGQFSIVVEDIIVGSESDTFTIQIDSVFFIDDQFNVYSIVPDTTRVIITEDTSSVTDTANPPLPARVNVFPNPASDYIVVEMERAIEQIEIFDATGRSIPLLHTVNRRDKLVISTAGWPSGLYYLKIRTMNQSIIKKLAIAPSGA